VLSILHLLLLLLNKVNNTFTKAATRLNTAYGDFDFLCYSWGPHEEDNILCMSNLNSTTEVLMRVQSACYTAEIFRSTDCDCHEQLDTSLKRIANEGGILIYMLCDGRGAGLLNKVRGLELGRTHNLNTSQAYEALNIPQDPRDYSRVVQVVQDLGIESVRLLTNNPRKIAGLQAAGIPVEDIRLEIPATSHSHDYLKTKALFMGHLMPQFGTDTSKPAPSSPEA
jgi:GTP cyclohydrolase II